MNAKVKTKAKPLTQAMSGADLFIEALKKEEVEVVFGYPGELSCHYMTPCIETPFGTF